MKCDPAKRHGPQMVMREANMAIAIRPGGRPITYGGRIVRSVTALFLAELGDHWKKVGTKVLDVVAEKYPDLYFQGMIQLAKINRVEIGGPGDFDRAKTKEEVLERLEERVGPKGRELLEKFLAKVARLEAANRADDA